MGQRPHVYIGKLLKNFGAVFVNKPRMAHKVLYYLAPGCFSHLSSYHSSPDNLGHFIGFLVFFELTKRVFISDLSVLLFPLPGKFFLKIPILFAFCLHLVLCSDIHPQRGLPNCTLLLPTVTATLHPALFSVIAFITASYYFIYLLVYYLFPVPRWITGIKCVLTFFYWMDEWRCGLTRIYITTVWLCQVIISHFILG